MLVFPVPLFVRTFAPENFGADCTVPGETDWEKLRAVIDYAHTWRETHKK